MKVWVVIYDVGYESSDIIGIYSHEEDAKKKLEEMKGIESKKPFWWGGSDYRIQEHDVE